VQSWYAEAGQVVSRYQSLNIPMTEYDVTNFSVGPLTVSAPEAFGETSVSVTSIDPATGDAAPLMSLRYAPFTEPILLAKSSNDVGPSEYTSDRSGHYEMMGRFRGSSEQGADFSGFAFIDHSWGPRDWGSIAATARWGHFIFGEDLYAVIYTIGQDANRFHYGHVYDAGQFSRVVNVDTQVLMAQDGHTPLRATITAWTDDDRGYVLEGTTDVSSVETQDGGHFWTGAYGTYTLRGRLAGGLLEVSERRWPSAEHRLWLNAHEPVVQDSEVQSE
jgi:hypothetical protein